MMTSYRRAIASNMQVIDSDSRCAHLTHVNAGAAIFSNRILDIIPKAQTYSLENELFPKLIARKSLWAYETHLRYYDMGAHEGLRTLESILNPAPSWHPQLS